MYNISFESDDKSETGSLGFESFQTETLSELNRVLKDSGPKMHTDASYVVHTSTIPLSSVLNLTLEGATVQHGVSHGGDTCQAGSTCMFTSGKRKGHQNAQVLSHKCPCLQFEEAEHLCFLTVLPSIGYRLDHSRPEGAKFEPAKIMWCTDAQSIFDESYGAEMTRITHKRGWGMLETAEEVVAAFQNLYWFKKHVAKKFVNKMLSRPINSLKSIVYNILQTIDGLLIKLFFSFPLETTDYESISRRTGSMFTRLLDDYFKESLDGPSLTYKELKPFLQEVGLLFHSRDQDVRMSIVDGGLGKYEQIYWFFQKEMSAYRDNIFDFWSSNEVDLTLTLSWKVRMAFFCKTRVIGHVPECDAYPSDIAYLDSLEETEETVDTDLLKTVAVSVPLGLSSEKVEVGGLRELYAEVKREDIAEIVEQLDLEVKPTADTTHTRSEGGKCESGRSLISKLRELHLQIPVRDLRSGEIEEWFNPPVPGDPGYKKSVFWASLQLVTMDLGQRFPEIDLNDDPERQWPKDLLDDLFVTEVVRIDEPGKIRRLVKTSNGLNAALAVGSHLLASQLAKGKSHKTGMTGSNQTWNFELRLDRTSKESAFMYTSDGTKLKDNIVCGFQDWSRASDYVNKRIGLALLAAAHRYTAFPPWYSKLTLMALGEPLRFRYNMFNTSSREYVTRTGWIRRGFMMGLQNTKNILHLIHYVAGFIAEKVLQQLGWNLRPSPPFQNPIIQLGKADVQSRVTSIYLRDNG